MAEEVSWSRVFAALPEVTGLPFRLDRNRWKSATYINGSPHHRHDKTVGYLFNGRVFLHENGGEVIGLIDWLLKYGGCSTTAQAFQVLRGYSGAALPAFREPEAPVPRFVDAGEPARYSGRFFGTLFCALSPYVGGKALRAAWRAYEVGVIYDTAIFWYRNSQGLICHDSRIDYLPNGHRDRSRPIRRVFTSKKGYTHTCLFGEHLCAEGRSTVVVESEKTALIGAALYPNLRWLATGGLEKVGMCAGMGYVVAPDFDEAAIERWSRAGLLWRWWEGREVAHGEDIGDLMLRLCQEKNR